MPSLDDLKDAVALLEEVDRTCEDLFDKSHGDAQEVKAELKKKALRRRWLDDGVYMVRGELSLEAHAMSACRANQRRARHIPVQTDLRPPWACILHNLSIARQRRLPNMARRPALIGSDQLRLDLGAAHLLLGRERLDF